MMTGEYQIVDLKTGNGDQRLRRLGLFFEVVAPGPDGGPTLIAACPTREAADMILQAYIRAAMTNENSFDEAKAEGARQTARDGMARLLYANELGEWEALTEDEIEQREMPATQHKENKT